MGTSIVTVKGVELESNTQSADEMVAAVKPAKEDGPQPKVISDRGKPPETKSPASEAASELGKLGGKASAEARAKAKETEAEAKPKADAKPEAKADKAKAEPEAKEAKAEEPKPEAKEPEKTKEGDPRHDARARINQLARERAEALERAERAERALQERERAEQRAHQTEASRPRREQYQTDEDYAEALADHRFSEKQREAEQTARVRSVAERRADHIVKYNERIQKDPEFGAKVDPRLLEMRPDFMLEEGEPIGPSNIIAGAIARSEHVVALGYHFTEHPEEMEALLRMGSPEEILLAMGRLEAKLSAPKPKPREPEPEAESEAPPPIKPLAASSVPEKPDLTDSGLDFDRFRQLKYAKR